jgi:mannose-6-phosphate isomerase-like protein (cupin superfamily)
MKPKIIKADILHESFLPEGCFLFENWGAATTGDSQVSVARARVEPGVTTKRHHLEGIQEIYLITQGKGRVTIGDLEPTEVAAGDLVVIPAGVRQQIANIGETDLVFYCICTPSFVQSSYHSDES